jgi:undecaprenyl-diphosphatase
MSLIQLVQILVLALVQGVTELFPISSLGHTVLLPGLLGWNTTLRDPNFVAVLVLLHLGTATALLTFFWRDWLCLLSGGIRVVKAGRFSRDVDPDGSGRQLALLVVGTIPAGLLGLFLQHPLEANFSIPFVASTFLVVNGAILLAGELLWQRQQSLTAVPESHASAATHPWRGPQSPPAQGAANASLGDKQAKELSFRQATLIGCIQAFALIPGFSRSGLTLVAGMASGLSHEAAARFSFLLATPIIAAAGVLEVPTLFQPEYRPELLAATLGGIVAGIAAFLSVRFLMKYFQAKRLEPFGYYCIALGLASYLYFALQTFHVL